MKNIFKRSLATVLSFVLILAVVINVNITANAATYIYNWGTRGQTATSLSQNAESFYAKNNTSYAQLSALAGSSNDSSVPSSPLYKALNNLMKSNHKKITSYDETKTLFKYTDCQNGGGKISSFYSGKEIGPSWDGGSTWNREHTWPNSKGDKAGSGENDLMMLRPTSSSENSARGNRAYGQSSGYYNPNSESGGKYDLRGDVARIVLYVYVRWECTNTGSKYNPNGIYGNSGVIESKKVLLDWIAADPVDTWELGRNDAAESILGTRNVFVDYPELAFVLLGEQVPTNYQTPSNNAQNGNVPTVVPSTPNNNNNQTNDNNNLSDTQNDNQLGTSSDSNVNTQQNTQTNTQETPQQSTQPIVNNCTHSQPIIIPAEEPRCETEGYTEGEYCDYCNIYISGRELIEPTGHIYDGDCDASCNVCNSVRELENVTHNYDDDICTICGVENEDKTLDEGETEDTSSKETAKRSYAWCIILGCVIVVGAGVTLVIIYRDKIWPKEDE